MGNGSLLAAALGAIVVAAPAGAMELVDPQEVPQAWIGQGWPTDFSRATVDFGEILSVLGPDNIPAIDDPEFAPVTADAIPGNEPVIALEIAGDARAYPIRILMWHEIVNDTVGGTPVAVTYCPLCNTSIVFDRRLDGEATTFGTTGKLRFSDLVMYDRAGFNWWQQFTGEAIAGKRAGEQLAIVPSRLMSYETFAAAYPDGQVLQPHPSRPGGSGTNPYADYDTSVRPFLFDGQLPDDIEPMARVVLVQAESPPVGVAVAHLRDTQPLRVGALEFRWAPGQASALDTPLIQDGRDIGNIEVVRLTEDGEVPVVHEVTFGFAAKAFYPDLDIIQ